MDQSSSDMEFTLQAVRSIEAETNVESIVNIVSDHGRRYGFTRLMIGQLVNPAMLNPSQIMVITDWPAELLKKRAQHPDRFVRDPIGQFALHTKRPFLWSEAYRHASRFGKLMIDEFRDFDMCEGIMFPVHSWESVPGGISFSTDQMDLSTRQISLLELVAMHAYTRLDTLLGPFPYQIKVRLTDRETDVLHYAAAGKTNREIAEILGIGMVTVRKHLQGAQGKLHTSNRAHSVAMAIAKGQITP
ncbi:MAG: LuxR family transcriptional regulator [Pseudomonadota bacterium]